MCHLFKYIIASILFIGLYNISYAQVEGLVSGVWTLADSPYCLSGDVEIAANTSLTIEAGVKVVAYGPYGITVNGSLQANGTAYEPIVFTYYDAVPGWKGIRFLPSSNNNLLEYCHINKVLNNDANIEGGAVYCSSSSVEISHCRIEDNVTASNGAGIFIANEPNHFTTIRQTIIQRNVAAQRGGGIGIKSAHNVVIENCLINKNEATQTSGSAGAGIHIVGPGNPTIDHCTIYGNEGFPDSGISVYLNSEAFITNCILWGNQGEDLSVNLASGGIATTSHCNIGNGQLIGTNNISESPNFVDEANNNYHLSAGSDCIDAGLTTSITTDFLDNARSSGTAPDMGAYEFGYFEVELIPTFVGCEGTCQGSIDIITSWGAEPFDTVWSNGQNTLLCEEDQTVTVTDGNGQVASNSIFLGNLHKNPIADFTVNNSVQCLADNLFQFENLSSTPCGNMNYLWYLGESGSSVTSTMPNPTQSYFQSDVYGVSVLVVVDVTGCSNAVVKGVEVIGTENGIMDTLELTACTGSTVEYNGEQLAPNTITNYGFTTAGGCDSTIVVIVSEATAITITETYTVCDGTSYDYNGTSIPVGTSVDFLSTDCDSLVTVVVTGGDEYMEFVTYETCDGNPYNYEGTLLNPNTNMDFLYEATNGCDSIVNVSIMEADSYYFPDTVSTCAGLPYNYNGIMIPPNEGMEFNTPTSAGCDSIIFIFVEDIGTLTTDTTVSICKGKDYIYEETGTIIPIDSSMTFNLFSTANNCDSVVTITVEGFDVFLDSVTVTACAGSLYQYDGAWLVSGTVTEFAYNDVNGCDSTIIVTVEEEGFPVDTNVVVQTCVGVPYNLDGLLINNDTSLVLVSELGCDSTVNLTLNEVGTITTQDTFATCFGEPYLYEGELINPNNSMEFAYISSLGCDSIANVYIEELAAISTSTDTFATCFGEPYLFEGELIPPNTSKDSTYISSTGCDSIVSIYIEELIALTSSDTFLTCFGEPYLYDGEIIAPNTSKEILYLTDAGCDSIATVYAEELPQLLGTDTILVCFGDFNHQLLSQEVIYFTSMGCDSTIVLIEKERPEITSSDTFLTCFGEPYLFDGELIAPNDSMEFIYTSSTDCDSTVTIYIEERLSQFSSDTFLTCFGEPYLFDGELIAPNDSMEFTYPSSTGCDSIVTIYIEEQLPLFSSDTFATCLGNPYLFDGELIAPNDSMDFTYTSSTNCDSIVTIFIEELTTLTSSDTFLTCFGEPYLFDGELILPNDSMDFTYTSSLNCDSIVTIYIEEVNETNETLSVNVCTGELYEFDGEFIAIGDSGIFNYTSQLGCDSTLTIFVDSLQDVENSVTFQSCAGKPYEFEGDLLLPDTETPFVYEAANGCDSTLYVFIEEVEGYSSIVEEVTCTFIEIEGNQIALGDSLAITYTAFDGCDSTVTFIAIPEPYDIDTYIDGGLCEGESFIINGEVFYPNTGMEFYYTGADGCDSIVSVGFWLFPSYEETVELQLCSNEIYEVNVGDSIVQLTAPSQETLTFESEVGCDSVVTYILSEYSDLDLDLGEDRFVKSGTEIILNALTTATEPYEINWDANPTVNFSCGNCDNPTFIANQSVQIVASINDANDCEVSDELIISVSQPYCKFPTAFSPNNDDVQDFFNPVSNENLVDYFIQIFDRWGLLVYEGNEYTSGWDGNLPNGEAAPIGVYLYVAGYQLGNQPFTKIRGNIALIR